MYGVCVQLLSCIAGGGTNATENMCMIGDNSTSTTCQTTSQEDQSTKYNGYYALLMIGNILLGIGAAPMFTIGLSYIDENCKPKMSSFYISKYQHGRIFEGIGFLSILPILLTTRESGIRRDKYLSAPIFKEAVHSNNP